MSDPPCPLCGQTLADPRPLSVCHACHTAAVGGGRVSATGEFRVEQILAAAASEAAEAVGRPAAEPGAIQCSWCGKPEDEVRKLLSRGTVHICNECVALCAAVLTAELGDDWQ
jgi:hypothetical protein